MTKKKPKIDIARAYDAPAPDGRFRVLVDRLWPRGVKKEDLKLDAWMKQVAPSAELRHWFSHDPQRWDEFRRRFFKELEANPDELDQLQEAADNRSALRRTRRKAQQRRGLEGIPGERLCRPVIVTEQPKLKEI